MWSSGWAVALALALHAGQSPAPAPTGGAPDDRPLTHVVQNLVRDAGRLPSMRGAEILAVGVIGAGIAHGSDHRVARWVAAAGTPSYTASGRIVGDGWVQGGAALATYAAGALTDSDRVRHIGSDLIRGQVLNAVLTQGLKAATHRARPSGAPRAFPSGHASATFTTAAILQGHLGWRVGVPAYAVAGFVGWTRVRDQQHWLSDVAFGSALGVLVGTTIAAGHQSRAVTVVPVRTPGGAAVFVYWQGSR